MPTGISSGFVCIVLPFILTQAGFSVATAGYVVAIAVSANFFRFLWGPIADFTLTPRLWYLIGLVTAVATLLLVGWIPLRPESTGLLFGAVFISQVAATFCMLLLGGLMAHVVEEGEKGRAAGWYQAGNLAGAGIGISAGIWLVAHYSKEAAFWLICIPMLACAVGLFFVSDAHGERKETALKQIKFLSKDVFTIFRSRISLFIAILLCLPIGAGAIARLWGGVWRDWSSTPDTLALVSGILSGLVAAIGCILGGYLTDRIGLWWAYFGSGVCMALVAIFMAIAPRTVDAFSAGVLIYSFTLGLSQAAFSALILYAIGRGAASTKYALLSSVGNLPVAYMTALDGWVHDQYGTSAMLYVDALSGLFFIIVAVLVLQRIRAPGTRQVSASPSDCVPVEESPLG
jgi:predicted MFS family arabinose efflux permease